ncbi:hypothetical protein Q3G72_020112 [Acer saccharum]|nr:hypothetical protein Q3G72_020112 [Acer saccharum]
MKKQIFAAAEGAGATRSTPPPKELVLHDRREVTVLHDRREVMVWEVTVLGSTAVGDGGSAEVGGSVYLQLPPQNSEIVRFCPELHVVLWLK